MISAPPDHSPTETFVPFIEFPKIARLSRECYVTEKIDGTNGLIEIDESGTVMRVGSRTRWLTDHADNYCFYAWAMANRDELLTLGPGRHFGEWWGGGIQRGYGLGKEKRFSLFNAGRWVPHGTTPQRIPTADPRLEKWQEVAPPCCRVVPVLHRGLFDTAQIEAILTHLGATGSQAAPGYMNPEGIIIYHTAAGIYFKKTLVKDEEWKGKGGGK